MNRIVLTGFAVAVVAILLVGCSVLGSPGGSGPSAATPTSEPTAEPTATPQSTATTEPSPTAAGGLPRGPHVLTKDIGTGVDVTVTITAPGWDGEANGGFLCWTSVQECAGPPDGAGLIAFNDREYYVYEDPCRWSTTRPSAAATTADVVIAGLANQASREASASEDITLDGYAGKRIILRMTDELDLAFSNGDFTDCDDGHFALFGVAGEDPARWSQGPGQIEEVWAVDVDGVVVVVIGTYYADTPQNAVDEVRAILGSMTFGELPDRGEFQLAYELDEHGYLADADGQNPAQIADSEEGECSGFGGEGPMWSPDGRYLAYRSGGGVCISDADGHPVASFPGDGWLISWSPDSTRVATWIDVFETVGIYGIDGERQALLTPPGGCVGSGDHDPIWSLDGQSVLVENCLMPIDGQRPRRLGVGDPRYWHSQFQHHHLGYSPDGTRVAYITSSEIFEPYVRTTSLVIADADGTELQVLTDRSDGPTGGLGHWSNLVWSPRADRLAFSWTTGIGGSTVASELRVLDVSSGEVTTIIAAEPGVRPLAYSPEGDRILYTTRDVNRDPTGLWSISVDGSGRQLLVPGSARGDWQPHTPES